jgi:hypothetical protein
MPYRHPGQEFLSRYGKLRSETDVLRYVEFLRQQAQLSDTPPIDLCRIYQHFGMPEPLRAPLDEQQGILVDSSTGIILIKEDDPLVRQRFTEGHELMELLFDAQDQAGTDSSLPHWSGDRKERLCDQGAADLLMPQSSFAPCLQQKGISLATARSLAALYETSLLATLVRMMQYGSGAHALVLWHPALKPTEIKTLHHSDCQPQKKLRIWWRTQTEGWSGGFIPKDKSIPHGSLISQTYASGQPQTGQETIDLGGGAIACQVEAMPIRLGNKPCVVSLLHLLEQDQLVVHQRNFARLVKARKTDL